MFWNLLFFPLHPPQLTTLRGAILEDAIPSTARHGTARGLPLKEVLEYVIPELSIQCLRQAPNSPKVSEQLLKLDEQGVCTMRASPFGSEYVSVFQNISDFSHPSFFEDRLFLMHFFFL